MNYGPEMHTYRGKTIGVYGGKFLPFHKGHLACILEAQSHVDILFVVVGYDEEYDRQLCKGTKFDYVSPRIRERWITEELKNFKNIRVLSQYERRSDNYMNDDSIHISYQELLNRIGGRIDKVFSSEHEYTGYFKKYLPMAEHVILNPERSQFNISATEIREKGVYEMWEYLPQAVRDTYVKRVSICGIESVGKSHNAKMAAKLFNTTYISEYGRDFYDEINGFSDISLPSDYEDIAVGHVYLMNQKSKGANKVAIIDTDLCYTHYFNHLEGNANNPVITSLIDTGAEKIDLYLFIEPYNEHELDGTRSPVTDHERLQRNKMLKDIYMHHIDSNKFVVIDQPNRVNRFKTIVSEINKLMSIK